MKKSREQINYEKREWYRENIEERRMKNREYARKKRNLIKKNKRRDILNRMISTNQEKWIIGFAKKELKFMNQKRKYAKDSRRLFTQP
jgi:hypothetical protein